jgi:hypothetical protein
MERIHVSPLTILKIIYVKYIIPLVCVMETQNILCEIGTGFLNVIYMNFRLQKDKQSINMYLR